MNDASTARADLAPLRGIHHLKFAVSDLDRSLRFYELALNASRIPDADHIGDDGAPYAFIVTVPGLGTLIELRLNPRQAERHKSFDAVTIAVDDRNALAGWEAHLAAHEILHSRILTALQAWLVVVEDPDGNRFRLYTLEKHEPGLEPDTDPWLDD